MSKRKDQIVLLLEDRLKIQELRDECLRLGLKRGGSKLELAERIVEHDVEVAAHILGFDSSSDVGQVAVKRASVKKKSVSVHVERVSQNSFGGDYGYSVRSRADSLLTNRTEIKMALGKMDPVSAKSALILADRLAACRGASADMEYISALVAESVRDALRHSDRDAGANSVYSVLVDDGEEILRVGMSITVWMARQHQRVVTASKWIGRGALVGIGALFGIIIS